MDGAGRACGRLPGGQDRPWRRRADGGVCGAALEARQGRFRRRGYTRHLRRAPHLPAAGRRDRRFLRHQGEGDQGLPGSPQGEEAAACEGVSWAGGVQGALPRMRLRRGLRLYAVEAPRARRAGGHALRQACAGRGAGDDGCGELLGARRDERKDPLPLHDARELLLRRDGDAGAQHVPARAPRRACLRWRGVSALLHQPRHQERPQLAQ